MKKSLMFADTNPHLERDRPLAFNLSDLQSSFGLAFNATPSRSLEVATSLYEKRLITYPRTACRYLPEHQFKESVILVRKIQTYFQCIEIDPSNRGPVWNDSKMTEHHGIIPFDVSVPALLGLDLTQDETRMYRLILDRFVHLFFI